MPQIWAGVDIGKTHHHCVVLDAEGKRLLSRRVLNDEPALLALLADVLAIDEDAVWAVDVADGVAALLISVLLNHSQQLLYIPGLAVNRASAGYRGMGKADAKDATVIADQARMRRDLTVLRPDDEDAVELRVLTSLAGRPERRPRPTDQVSPVLHPVPMADTFDHAPPFR
ncbi:Transposase [Streptomyces sp. Ncost-T10-10d]|nr:Transposase [Streptomyces sp. Ncost-T10-10d]